MSVSSVPSLIAALSMKPVSPMLVRNIVSACMEIAEVSQQDKPMTAPIPNSAGSSATGGGLDQRA
ncbi:MAG: hypothetical protein ABTQ27_06905 [Amaricoccus sp.]|uniref:hypothetical protein n=1 Tax=Amaricoccus sp. TaxID=1872485 RepID=UPI003315D9FD